MKYKAFEDWYREGNIKHLLLYEYNGYLISPPFATERCKEYNKILKYDGSISYIETKLPHGTSKTNCVLNINGSAWLIPYGIYSDNMDMVLKLKDDEPEYIHILANGKGQFYSGASDGVTGFSFPLGYEGTQYCLYIKNDITTLIPFNSVNKAHMGTVYCNGKYYSMPRGDEPNYNNLVSFDGENFEYFYIPVDESITRKFTDIVTIDHTLYSLPYGEQSGLNEVVEFNTSTKEIKLHKLDMPDFAKKFNSMVRVGDKIIGLPYGDEHCTNSNYGIVFDTVTKKSKPIDIGITHGGKYRYRSGIEYRGYAIFFPTGSPQCPIMILNQRGSITGVYYFDNVMFGRPIIYKGDIHVLAYDTIKETHHLYIFSFIDKFEFKVINL